MESLHRVCSYTVYKHIKILKIEELFEKIVRFGAVLIMKLVRKAIAIRAIVNTPRVFTSVGKISVPPTIAVFHFFELGPRFQKNSVVKNDLRMVYRM